MRIDIWSDIACPWCYIGLTRFDRVLAEFPHADEVSVTLHAFQLDPTLPESYDGTESEYLAQTKRIPEAQVRQMFSHVEAAAATEDLTLDFDTIKVANSRRARTRAGNHGTRRARVYRVGGRRTARHIDVHRQQPYPAHLPQAGHPQAFRTHQLPASQRLGQGHHRTTA